MQGPPPRVVAGTAATAAATAPQGRTTSVRAVTLSRVGVVVHRVQSFPPLVGDQSRILILGSLPGAASLAAGAYYAHPRNAFWALVADVTGAAAGAPYDERAAALVRAGLALWDVARAAVRPGSLDADIDDASVEPHDVAGLLAAHPSIRRVCCNGAKAAALFRRHVAPRVDIAGLDPIDVRVLPSTSPAHAGVRIDDKRAAWLAALRAPLADPRAATASVAQRG